ncbi:helix-turn-helix domain-containing protein [Chryseobacterium sp. CT-SW4]|uniref:helix-turn-helix domain-containing protein n=1 Tax=Chryseobacterium sp. SW-1 TaxID=3157343 RepID=UPI003B01CA6B
MMKQPNYKKIYTDIINKKYPEKLTTCKTLLLKNKLSFLDVIKLNQKIFGNNETLSGNQRHRSYDVKTIFEILDYQKKHNLNNSQLAIHFKLSRNTVAKWKKNFAV